MYFAILRNFRCPLPSLHLLPFLLRVEARTLPRRHPFDRHLWFLPLPARLCDAPPRSNIIGIVHILLRFSDWLKSLNLRKRALLSPKEQGMFGVWWNPGKSIRWCPPVTRQSGLILCEERVGSLRARSVNVANTRQNSPLHSSLYRRRNRRSSRTKVSVSNLRISFDPSRPFQ